MSGMTEGSAVETSLVPRHRRKRVIIAVLVFVAGLASVSWVGSASPYEQTANSADKSRAFSPNTR
ncbi:hypothetical protein SAMN04487961_1584 [Marinobacter pelagius]|uniref:Uncharacterized protein n=1 Tax=Marinobacter pelagius TaxID=379482 RepID=A0A1I4UUQ5_9GAMM|nr:hypothetical protein SAMN04487961_1584 [Marinobacter pelagius]